mgnify:CR=1 FL=1
MSFKDLDIEIPSEILASIEDMTSEVEDLVKLMQTVVLATHLLPPSVPAKSNSQSH